MTVFRVNKTGDYTVMSNAHFKETEMSLKAKGLLSLMLSLPDSWDYSISGLAALSKDGKESIMNALGELEQFGYLTRNRLVDEKGRFAGYEYNIFESPQTEKPRTEKPYTGNPNTDNPNTEKPYTGNPPQLNTKESNTNILNTKESKERKTAAASSFDKLLDTYSKGNAEIRTLLGDWLKVRKAKRAAMTDRAIELNLKKLDGLAAESGMTVAKYLEEVICRGWSAFYKINDYSKPTPRKESTFGSFDTDEFFDLAAKRSQPKTAGEDASIRERAEALKKQFAESKAEPAATVDAADSDLLTQLKEMYGAEK